MKRTLTSGLLVALTLASGAAAQEAGEPQLQQAEVSPEYLEAEVTRAGALRVERDLLRGTERFEVRADPRHHHGEPAIDAGRHWPGELTAHETSLLDAARAAVEAARAEGRLHVTAILDENGEWPTELAAQAKLEAWENHVVEPLTEDEVAGIGDFPAVQEIGPPGLSAGEQRKLEQTSTWEEESLERDEDARPAPATPPSAPKPTGPEFGPEADVEEGEAR